MSPEFQVHKLTPEGMQHACAIAAAFDLLLVSLSSVCPSGREFAVCKTKLEEACFFAKKAMSKAYSEVP